FFFFFFFSSRRRHTRFDCDWSSDVCSSDLAIAENEIEPALGGADVDRARRVTAVKHHGGAGDRARSAGHAGTEETGAATHDVARSEERRVGKECRSWWGREQ